MSLQGATAGGGKCPITPFRVAAAAGVGAAVVAVGYWLYNRRKGSGAASVDKVTLRIVQITDVYKLDNFPPLKNLIKAKRAENLHGPTISVLTGDFLAPYLLSAFDKGSGMMKMINGAPIDYLIWGNHEDDLEHQFVCQAVKQYQGKWINTNMQSHEMFKDHQIPYEVLEVTHPGTAIKKKVGMIGILSNGAWLYKANPFNGAKIEDPWATMAEYKTLLENEKGCDVVVPLCHLYVPEDHRTCETFDFPVILSGHDHHVVNEVHAGTRLVKSGIDGDFAQVVDLTWDPAHPNPDGKPTVTVELLNVADFPPDEDLQLQMMQAYSVLDNLKKTQLALVPDSFRPLTTKNARGARNTGGTLLASWIKQALNTDDLEDASTCECVLLPGGEVRGSSDYTDGAYFSMADLRSEITRGANISIITVPGQVISDTVKASHDEGPNPNFMQLDDMMQQGKGFNVTHINGKKIDLKRMYRVATVTADTFEIAPMKEYITTHRDELPPSDASWPIRVVLLDFFARSVWSQLWQKLDTNQDGTIDLKELSVFDVDQDGSFNKAELKSAMATLGLITDRSEDSFVDFVMRIAGDDDNDGVVSLADINRAMSNKQKPAGAPAAAAAPPPPPPRTPVEPGVVGRWAGRQSLYSAAVDGRTTLATLSLAPGCSVYGETLVVGGGVEYRLWNPRRSHVAAALIKHHTEIVHPGMRILYIGGSSGSTASHLADIVGLSGVVYAVEPSYESAGDLVRVSKKRPNVVPIISDPKRPEAYKAKIVKASGGGSPVVDLVLVDEPTEADVSVDITATNTAMFLKPGGVFAVVVDLGSSSLAAGATTEANKQAVALVESGLAGRGLRSLSNVSLVDFGWRTRLFVGRHDQ